jgi:2-iminoacetate synthase ThiH
VHFNLTSQLFIDIFQSLPQLRPHLHIKPFIVVQYQYIPRKATISIVHHMKKLINAASQSISGGEADIFNEKYEPKFVGINLLLRNGLKLMKQLIA